VSEPRLLFSGISKAFPGVQALNGVSFGVRGSSVMALCGENGAGKSTLLKALSGVHPPDSGQILLDGEPFSPAHPADAIAAGVAVIYQELHLFPDLSVAENLFAGHLPGRRGMFQRSQLMADSRRLLESVGADVAPEAMVGRLPIAQRQMVEIAKAVSHDARVIAFDEPTSSLSEREVAALFTLIERLQSEGRAILYVSHRMSEILRICDAATVLRDGRHVRTYDSLQGVSEDQIIVDMVGRSIEDVYAWRAREIGALALDLEGLSGPGVKDPVNLQVHKGEVVGLFGLVGAGRTELLNQVYGSVRGSGTVRLNGTPLRARSPIKSIAAGLVFCPEDRKKQGIFPIASVQDNVNASVRRRFSPSGMFISNMAERVHAQVQVDQLRVKTPSLSQPVKNLSGGNQQKVILGRWLSGNVKAVLLDEPTRGIDVGAKSEIYQIIYGLAEQGVAVLVASSELSEVLGISDRVGVMCEGRLTGILPREQATQEAVMRLALPRSS
jgi:L-arabinose transport system ATP-binding protein